MARRLESKPPRDDLFAPPEDAAPRGGAAKRGGKARRGAAGAGVSVNPQIKSLSPGAYAEVAVDSPVDGLFTYSVPAALAGTVAPGVLVRVPFGGRRVVSGCVVRVRPGAEGPPEGVAAGKVRPVAGVVSSAFSVGQDLIDLALWMADFYVASPGEALGCVSFLGFRDAGGKTEARYVAGGAAAADDADGTPGEARGRGRAPTARQTAVLDALAAAAAGGTGGGAGGGAGLSARELKSAAGATPAVLKAMTARRLLTEARGEVDRGDDYGPPPPRDRPLPLNGAQRVAVERVAALIDAGRHRTALLHGVTGSGKTEVYLRAIAHALGLEGGMSERGALDGEAALVPRLVGRLFPEPSRTIVPDVTPGIAGVPSSENAPRSFVGPGSDTAPQIACGPEVTPRHSPGPLGPGSDGSINAGRRSASKRGAGQAGQVGPPGTPPAFEADLRPANLPREAVPGPEGPGYDEAGHAARGEPPLDRDSSASHDFAGGGDSRTTHEFPALGDSRATRDFHAQGDVQTPPDPQAPCDSSASGISAHSQHPKMRTDGSPEIHPDADLKTGAESGPGSRAAPPPPPPGGAIVLVPEIALTPQAVGRFRARFGDMVGVYHSRLTLGQKFDLWRRIRGGSVRILVGARSAVFAPFHRLAIVVVDEEHEGGYKQDAAPRYHGRDMAILRAQRAGAVALLGSATPSIETYRKAQTGKFELIPLPDRVDGRALPAVTIVDMAREAREEKNPAMFSGPLMAALTGALGRGEQALLFLNRRGYFNFLLCMGCQEPMKCDHCDVPLTHHRPRDTMRCHYCDATYAMPEACPACGAAEMSLVGMGTQRLEDEVARLFPAARIARLDLDTTRRRTAFLDAWRRIEAGEIDVVLGTQMIAKGVHLEGVTVVGVPLADVALFQPDFRSAERAFAMLTQVAGRAGRGERPGEVFIQTYAPAHYAVGFARTHDYRGFYEKEIRVRQVLRFPPFRLLAAVLATGPDEAETKAAMEDLADRLRTECARAGSGGGRGGTDGGSGHGGGEGMQVLGPAPAGIRKIKDQWRWRLLLRGTEHAAMRGVLRRALAVSRAARTGAGAGGGRVHLAVDIDPLDVS